MTSSIVSFVESRQPLYAGVVGCLGVGLAWLIWVARHAFDENWWQVLVAPIVGAVVGMIVEFFRHHVAVSAREAREPTADAPVIPEAVRQRVREDPAYAERSGTLALAGLVAGVFLVGVCSNLVGDLMLRLVEPFLTTLALFFPIGLWLGSVFRDRRTFDGWGAHLGRGLQAGVGAAVIAFAVSLLLGLIEFSVATLLGFLGWWLLLGIGWGIAYGSCYGPKPFAPTIGTAFAAGLLLVSAGPASSSGGLLGPLRYVTDPLSSYALAQPGLPSRFWEVAVQELNATPPSSQTTAPLPQAFGAAGATERSRFLTAQLELGLKSDLARSWLIFALFSAAVGLGRWSEARLRPLDYDRSRTRRNDVFLVLGATAVWLGALVYVAIRGW